MKQKQQFCDSAKCEYAAELQKTNSYQREHFDRLMPEITQVIILYFYYYECYIGPNGLAPLEVLFRYTVAAAAHL